MGRDAFCAPLVWQRDHCEVHGLQQGRSPGWLAGLTNRPHSEPATRPSEPLGRTTPSDPGALPGSAHLIDLSVFEDDRGRLSVAEVGAGLPFEPRRYFLVDGVPADSVRGGHAHREASELLSCPTGSCVVTIDDGHHRSEVVLETPTKALYVPPMIWTAQAKHTPNATLLVLSDKRYDPAGYIFDYDSFRAVVERM